MTEKIKLPTNVIDKHAELPGQGMGSQVVNVTHKNGNVLIDRRVGNSAHLILADNE